MAQPVGENFGAAGRRERGGNRCGRYAGLKPCATAEDPHAPVVAPACSRSARYHSIVRFSPSSNGTIGW